MHRESRRSWIAVGAIAVVVAAAIPSVSALPASADGGNEQEQVSVDAGSHTVTLNSSEVGLQLPGDTTTAEVNTSLVADDLVSGHGEPLLNTAVGSAVLSSYSTDDGAQTLIQISGANAPTEYRFPMALPEGGQAALFEDGTVVISDSSGTAINGFRAPWAVDANGSPVPTSFRVEGAELVQFVGFTDTTAFPVTADPDLGTEWWGYYVQLTRSETMRAASVIASNQGAGVVAGVACSALPGPAAVACGTAIALAYFTLVDPINRANSSGRCAAVNVPWLAWSNPAIGWTSINTTTVNCRR